MKIVSPNFEPSSIVRAKDDLLYIADGRCLVDLFTGHGTVWIGHCNAEVQRAIVEQLDTVWITGGHPTPAVQAMRETVDIFLPKGFSLASLASTGMEANEQALRIARVSTGRNEAIGLAGAMHGKSFFTAALAWNNFDGLIIPHIHRINSGMDTNESTTLNEIEDCLCSRKIAAVYIEPIHGTSYGWEASNAFYQALRLLTAKYGTLLIYDEVLTGFYRTGSKFRFQKHGVEPDIVVFGKACGNGFPVAGVASSENFPISPRMFLGSTFSNNALAASVITATINFIERINIAGLVTHIERIILENLGWAIAGNVVRMRGAGAMWVISLRTDQQAFACAKALYQSGVCIGFHNSQLRLLPSATIRPENLNSACITLSEILTSLEKYGDEAVL